MKRAALLLTVLGFVLVAVLWYLLLWSPKSEELAVVEEQILAAQTQQTTVRSRITALEGVRERAPQIQAELAASESLLPRDTALPSALRQLQQAADESGAVLVSVAPSRPTAVEGADPQLYQLGVNVQLEGAYFSIVDVLRRLEDPAISPRGFVWNNVSIALGESGDDQTVDMSAPGLTVALTGSMFAVLPAPPAEGADDVEGAADPEGEAGTDGADGSADESDEAVPPGAPAEPDPAGPPPTGDVEGTL